MGRGMSLTSLSTVPGCTALGRPCEKTSPPYPTSPQQKKTAPLAGGQMRGAACCRRLARRLAGLLSRFRLALLSALLSALATLAGLVVLRLVWIVTHGGVSFSGVLARDNAAEFRSFN